MDETKKHLAYLFWHDGKTFFKDIYNWNTDNLIFEKVIDKS